MFKGIPDLTIEKLPRYLSPSSMSNFYKMPNTFYLQRLILDRMPREPQSLAAGVGTAFDILVKEDLIERGIPCAITLEEIKSSLENEDIIKESYEVGKELLKIYRRTRLYLTSKFTEVEGVNDTILTISDVDGTTLGDVVPLFGKLDAKVYDEEYDMESPMDWKCSGWTSKSGVSPKKGFQNIYNSRKNDWDGPHKLYHKNIGIEEIDASWAAQFTTYGWFLQMKESEKNSDGVTQGSLTLKEFPVYAHHPIFNGKGKVIKIAVYRAIVTVEYQKELWKKYQLAWKELNNGRFLNRIASKRCLHLVYANASNERWF